MKLDDKTSLSNSVNKILNNWNSYSENALNLFEEKYDIKNIEKHFEKIKYFA